MVAYIGHTTQGGWVQNFHRQRVYINVWDYKIFKWVGSYTSGRWGHGYKPANAVGWYIDVSAPVTGLAVTSMYDHVWPMLLVATVEGELQNGLWSWFLHWCTTNVPPTVLVVTIGNGLQNCGYSWFLHWRMANVPAMVLVVTTEARLQNYLCHWLLHWHTTNVPPMALVVTMGNGLQNCECSWLLHWCTTNVPPMMLVDMVEGELQNAIWSWLLHQLLNELDWAGIKPVTIHFPG